MSLGGDGKMSAKNRITIRMPIELNLIGMKLIKIYKV